MLSWKLEKIGSFIDEFSFLNETLIPFYVNNRTQYDDWREAVLEQFPDYYSEVQGLADGTGIPFYIMFLLNIQAEISALVDPIGEENAHCTDLFYNSEDEKGSHIRGHNEDGNKINKPYVYFLDIEITGDKNKEKEHFFAYCYPGVLPGIAYGWNDQNLILTGNALYPKEVRLGKTIPKTFIYRYSLSSKSIPDAISKFQGITNRAYGVTINIGNLQSLSQVSIELSPYEMSTMIIYGNFSHMNNYKVLTCSSAPFYYEESSVHRQERVDEFPSFSTMKEILTILGDTADPEYPLYRNSSISTLSTVFYDMDESMAYVYTDNPKFTDPVQIFQLTL